MKCSFLILALLIALLPVSVHGQILDPVLLTKPATDAWPTYNGDYSGRRFSSLRQINKWNVKSLSLAWIFRIKVGATPGAIIGGEGVLPEGPPTDPGVSTIKATPLMVKGILYFSTPDNAWAVDVRSGRELWHYTWKTKGGIH